eukprot:tig00000042_g15497.t1
MQRSADHRRPFSRIRLAAAALLGLAIFSTWTLGGHLAYFLAYYAGVGVVRDDPLPAPASCADLEAAAAVAERELFPRDVRSLLELELPFVVEPGPSGERQAVVMQLLADERGRAYADEAALALRALARRYFGREELGRPRPPVIVFHDGALGAAAASGLRAALGGAAPLHLVGVARALAEPTFLRLVGEGGWARCEGHVYGAAYLHMNVWRIFYQWEALAALGVDRAWSLDSDLYARRPLPSDPLRAAQEAGLDYAYWRITSDPEACVPLQAAERFFSCRRPSSLFRPSNMYPLGLILPLRPPRVLVFQGNFQVARVGLFRGPAYRSFAALVGSLGGIRARRWSDQALFSLFLAGEGVRANFSDAGEALCHKFCGARPGDEGFLDPDS